MALTNAGKVASLAADYGASRSPAWPATVFVALSVGDLATTGAELTSAGGYARAQVANDGTFWNAPQASGLVTNKAGFSYPTSTGAWSNPNPDHFGIYDSGGNLLETGTVSLSGQMNAANLVLNVPAGSLQVNG